MSAVGDRPFLSVIVVAWNVEAWIEECLESCLEVVPRGHEVIVVHNASEDATRERIQRIVSLYPGLFRTVDNDRNLGLGQARNQGMRLARGDYLLFLDGDDYYLPGALTRVAEVLSERAPELLVINFARVFDASKEVTPNKETHQLGEGWRNEIARRRRLFRNFGSAWNKVYSRALIERNHLQFPEGLFEDIVWNAECIVRSQSIYVIPDVLLHYRQRRGSIRTTTDVRHFDTIRRHRALVDLLAKEPELRANYGDTLRDYSRMQMFSTLNSTEQIPKNMKGRYLLDLVRTLNLYDQVVGQSRKTWLERIARTRSFRIYQTYRWAKAKYARSVQLRV